MAKRRLPGKAPGRSGPDRGRSQDAASQDFETGNAFAATEMGEGVVPIDIGRDAALPWVRHAALALELRWEVDTPYDRLAALVSGSNLASDTRDFVAGRLHQAHHVRSEVERIAAEFDGGREGLQQALRALEADLRSGTVEGDRFVVSDRTHVVPAAHSAEDAADKLVTAVSSAAVLTAVRSLALRVFFDEEEEAFGSGELDVDV